MLYRTHAAFSLLVAMLILVYTDMENPILFIVLVMAVSLIADIDTYRSKIGSKVKFLSIPINKIFRHRGFFHSIWFPLALFFVFISFGPVMVSIAFLSGYFSHLILDSFTKEGILPLFPIKKKFSGYVRTGSMVENIIFILLAVIDILMITAIL